MKAAGRAATLATPIAINLAMPIVYRSLGRRLGPRRGYLAGFGVYWGLCFSIPTAILGPSRAARTLVDRRGPSPLETLLLVMPPLGGLATQTVPALRADVRINVPLLATAGAFAITNSLAEEFLWRGLFLEAFADSPLLGIAYPAAGFGLWHLAPQQVDPAPNPLAFCAAAALLGLVNGWVAGRLGGIRAVTVSHALADATGVASFAAMLGRGTRDA